jgi:hypothetical protein
LKAYDGSVANQSEHYTNNIVIIVPSSASSPTRGPTIEDTVAVTAFRYAISSARTAAASCQDRLASVTAKAVPVEFEFPTDWLQLDRSLGGIQYMDQRNGDKLYGFRVSLPSVCSEFSCYCT